MEVINRYVTTKTYIKGTPKESDFEIKSSTIVLSAEPLSNDVVLKNLYISIDPYQIHRFKGHTSSDQKTSNSVVTIAPGEVISAYGVAKVVASGNPMYTRDDLVVGTTIWADYGVLKASEYMLRKLHPKDMGFPLSHQIGVFGFSGLTAYAGLFEVGKPKKGEKVFVSAASGSVGHLVGQYAKQYGCYVVGCAGSNEKVALLKEKLGFDDAFNYKDQPNLNSALKKYFPDGIDIYFDNVGAHMLEATLANMNSFGRVVSCGMISEYTDTNKRAAPNMLDIVYKRIMIQGFMTTDYLTIFPDFLSATMNHIRLGSLKTLEDISTGLESIPQAFVGLFHGANVGKKMVKLVDE
ncbi:2-alkenal reductase (NADP(+)-dependent)-like [Humulus lupulus]|uniref:2-alkenal reductase (NADP(+)-dependent)-like n=1 Tax=Humulus lupulus TaxID=3486 RepID=UPI002B4106EB|nr:2-alkenal reductase (NADP(+)-dependent)-like [Humulus lupulus]